MYTESQFKVKTILLLEKIQNSYITYTPTEYWYEGLGESFEDVVSNLFAQDLLRHPSFLEILDTATIAELKEVLKNNSLPVTGKKADLVERIKKNVNPDSLKTLRPSNSRYTLSEKGQAFLEEYKADFNQALDSLYELLVTGDKEVAAKVYVDYKTHIWLPTSSAIPKVPTVVEFIERIYSFDYTDLNNTDEFKSIFKAVLALNSLFEINIYNRLSQHTSEPFSCPELIKDIKKYDIFFYDGTPSCINQAIAVYIQTKVARYRESLENMSQCGITSVKISTCGDGAVCSTCKKAEKKVYSLSNIDHIPKLPLHYGCRCTYIVED